MAGHGVGLEQRHAVDHVLALADERRIAVLPGVAAIEEGHAVAALGPDGAEHRRDAIEPAHAAIGLRKRGEILGRQRIGGGRRARNVVKVKQCAAGHVRNQAPRRADAEIDRRLAEIDRLKLAVDVGDVQQRDIAERIELQQLGLAQPLLRHSAATSRPARSRPSPPRPGSNCAWRSLRLLIPPKTFADTGSEKKKKKISPNDNPVSSPTIVEKSSSVQVQRDRTGLLCSELRLDVRIVGAAVSRSSGKHLLRRPRPCRRTCSGFCARRHCQPASLRCPVSITWETRAFHLRRCRPSWLLSCRA